MESDELRDRLLNPENYVMPSVSDNGTGISPDIRNMIFEPYFTTRKKGKETGPGLRLFTESLRSIKVI
ncbi:ATP-binding protein [Desulfobacula sp.]|uniref:ATP-binding protein n=1 Tax=Desulfobacula sp. TaxID=2593537 RepID=UPI0039B9C35F